MGEQKEGGRACIPAAVSPGPGGAQRSGAVTSARRWMRTTGNSGDRAVEIAVRCGRVCAATGLPHPAATALQIFSSFFFSRGRTQTSAQGAVQPQLHWALFHLQ